LQLVQKKRQE
jgi:hypothetical protein